MSTSLLYHALGLQHQEYLGTEYTNGAIIFKIRTKPSELRCSYCNSYNVRPKGIKERKFKAPPIGKKRIFIEAKIQRLECRDCGAIRQEPIKYADYKKTYTKVFRRYALDLLKVMTMQDVAKLLGVGWDMIKEIQKEYLEKHYGKPELKNITRIAIDEISIQKGHKYFTVVMDLDTGAIVYVGEGKDSECLEPFWKRLKRSGAKIEAVAIDMSPAYIEAVTKHLHDAKIVFDHFHIIKLYNDKLTELRRDLYNFETDDSKKKILKGTRWLILMNRDKIENDLDALKKLEEALQINKSLAIAYYLGDELKFLWGQMSKEQCKKALGQWVAKSLASGIKMLISFANTLLAHRNGIFNWYDHKISSGPLEGFNNKIKVMKRQAYGFRDKEFFKLKIYALHDAKYALSG